MEERPYSINQEHGHRIFACLGSKVALGPHATPENMQVGADYVHYIRLDSNVLWSHRTRSLGRIVNWKHDEDIREKAKKEKSLVFLSEKGMTDAVVYDLRGMFRKFDGIELVIDPEVIKQVERARKMTDKGPLMDLERNLATSRYRGFGRNRS
jgi:hypothetical protein